VEARQAGMKIFDSAGQVVPDDELEAATEHATAFRCALRRADDRGGGEVGVGIVAREVTVNDAGGAIDHPARIDDEADAGAGGAKPVELLAEALRDRVGVAGAGGVASDPVAVGLFATALNVGFNADDPAWSEHEVVAGLAAANRAVDRRRIRLRNIGAVADGVIGVVGLAPAI